MTIVVQKEAGNLSALISGNKWLEVVNTSQVFPCNSGGNNVGYRSVETERYVDFTPSKGGDLQGVILALHFGGDDITDDATYTVKLQEDSGGWVDRLTKSISVSDLVPAGKMRRFGGLVDFRFASTYTITAVAGTWRLAISGTAGPPTPYVIYSENGSDDDHIFHVPYLSSTQALGASDAVVVTDVVTIDQNWTVGAHDSQSGTQTGLNSRNRYWAIYGCTPNLTDGTDPKIYVPSTIVSDISLEFEGSVFVSGYQTGLLIGEDSNNPIPVNRQVDVYWSGTGVSTKNGGLQTNAGRYCGASNVQLFGTPPTSLYAYLSEAATVGTNTIKVNGDVTTEWLVGHHIMIGGGQSGPNNYRDYAKSEYKEIQGTVFAAGVTTITLTTNLLYDHIYLSEGTPVVLHERNVTLRGVWTEIATDTLYHDLDGGWIQALGVAFDNIYQTKVSQHIVALFTKTDLDNLEIYWRRCHFHNSFYGPRPYVSYASLVEVSDCSDSDTRIHSSTVALTALAYASSVYTNFQALRNFSVGRKSYCVTLERCRFSIVDSNYLSGFYAIRYISNTTDAEVTNNVFHKCRFVHLFRGCIRIYLGQNVYRDIYDNSVDPDGSNGCYYSFSNTINFDVVSEDDDLDDVGNVVYTGSSGVLATIVVDNAKLGIINGDIVSETYRDEWVPGTVIAFVNYDETAGHTKTWETDGYLESTGIGLPDTEAHTAGAGKLAWRMNPYYTDQPYDIKFEVPADVVGKPVAVQAWCKIKSLNYAAGTYQAPKLKMRGLGITPVEAAADVGTTEWQLIVISAVPIRRGQFTATLSVETDATGSDAYVYWDDVFLSHREPIDLGGLDLQADGFFPSPPLSSFMTPAQVWAEQLADIYVPGTAGGAMSALRYKGKVFIDPSSSYSGTTYPAGTEEAPVNNITDARTIADNIGVRNYVIAGSVTLNAAHLNWNFTGVACTPSIASIDINGQNVAGSSFHTIGVTGQNNGFIQIHNSDLTDVSDFQGNAFGTILQGTIALATGESSFLDCHDGEPGLGIPIIDVGGAGRVIGIRGWNGGIELRNVSDPGNLISVNVVAGRVILHSSCSDGEIVIHGVVSIIDNSTGSTIIQEAALARTPIQALVLNDATPFAGADVASIKGKTDNLPTDPADESNQLAQHTVTQAAISGLENLSQAEAQTAAAAALTTYDPPTRADATADKNAIITEIDTNETKIDALPLATEIDTQLSGTHGPDSWESDTQELAVIRGLMHELALIDQIVENENGLTGRLRIYDNRTNQLAAQASSPIGGTTGSIYTAFVQATYENWQLKTYMIVPEP